MADYSSYTLLRGASFGDALVSGLIGGASAAAFVQLGSDFSTQSCFRNQLARDLGELGAFGLVGGITSQLQGGKFGHGFLSASLSGPITNGIAGPSPDAGRRTIARMLVGGGISELSGGKFANGAAFAAFAAAVQGFVGGSAGYILGNAAYGVHSLFGRPGWTRPTWSFGNNAIQFENNPLSPGGAITLGNTISYGGGTNPSSFGQHELQHIKQGQWLGPFYLPANIIGQAASLLTYPIRSLRGPSPLHGQANFMEIGPLSSPPRATP